MSETGSRTVDTAWAEAEAALPDGWKPLIGREDGGWWATATEPRQDHGGYRIVSTSERGVLYPSMVTALDALRAALDRLDSHEKADGPPR